MRILHLSSELASHPGISGGASRQYFLLKQLVDRGAEVRSICAVTDERLETSNAIEICSAAGIDLHPVRRDDNRLKEAAAAVLRDRRAFTDLFTAPWFAWRGSIFWTLIRSAVDEQVRDWHPDLILIEHDHLAHWAPRITTTASVVLMTHNASWQYYASRADSAQSFLQRARMRLEERRFLRFVRRNIAAFASVVTTSHEDAMAFAELGAIRTCVVPNGADCSAVLTDGPGTEGRIAFIGTLNYAPNVEGLRWFTRSVWPALREAAPSASLAIVGRAPTEEVSAMDDIPGVDVVGPVPEVLPYLNEASILIAPLLSGGGTKLKVVEAFAARRPLVATSNAVVGIDAASDREYLLADEASDFAAATARLIEDPQLRSRLATAGRELAVSNYDWPKQGDLLFEELEALGQSGSD